MLATLVDARSWISQRRGDWRYQRKLDGLRCLAVRNRDHVQLWSRNHKSFDARFGQVASALAGLDADTFTLDGELVAFDGNDFAGFGALQQHGSELDVVYGIFDVLHVHGRDVRMLPLAERAALLAGIVPSGPWLRPVEELAGDPEQLLAGGCARGWEGLIAKRSNSLYVAGRSPDWCKLKCSAGQELVIGGWTEPRGSRHGFGALLVGYHDDEGGLRYAGKVGTGFSAQTLSSLSEQLGRLARDDSPFVDSPRAKTTHWVEPRLVGQVAFSEWTRDGRLRHPRFEGLRPDKDAAGVVRERPTRP